MNISPEKTSLMRVVYAAIFLFALVLLHAPESKAQQWATADNNSNNIKNTNTGDVGIGTGSPNYKLDLSNALDKAQIRFGMGAFDSGGYLFSNAPAHAVFSAGASWDGGWKAKSMSTSSMQLNAGAIMFFADTNAPQSGYFTPTERMRIASNGYVGIGTSTPGYPLEIYNNQNGIAQMVFNNPSSGTSAQAAFSFYEGSTQKAKFGVNSSGASGYVGGVNAFQIWNFQNAPVLFATNSTERMRIAADGTVAIGMSPDSNFKLNVQGAIRSWSGGFVFPDGSVQLTAATGGGGGGTITGVTAGLGLSGGGTSGGVTLNNTDRGSAQNIFKSIVNVVGGTPISAASNTDTLRFSGADGAAVSFEAQNTIKITNSDRGSVQSIFKNVKNAAGVVQFFANDNNDSIAFEGTGGTSVSFNVSAKRITIDSNSNVAAANVSAGSFASGNYSFPGNLSVTGNIGINGAATEKLEVTGNVKVNGNINVTGNINAKYQDVAEWVESSQELPAATVVVLDTTRTNQVVASTQSYDSRIAGVISIQPGLALGEQGEGRVLVATTGRVKVKVDASNGAIQIGDLLVTSDREGYAMKSTPVDIGGVRIHRPGTLIGKALEPLANGTGEILVLLSLQ